MLQYCFCFMFWFFGLGACGILTPQLGFEPAPPELEDKNLNCWTARKIPAWYFHWPLGEKKPYFLSLRLSAGVPIAKGSCSVCLILCHPMDCSLPGSSIRGIFQARVLSGFSFSRGSSQPRDWTQVSCIAGRCFTIWATREACNKGQFKRQKQAEVY